ncbi:hypothetical protein, partial [Serratia surfactantfaciens]|uniref:hypothetical protein n=1 Tax=Serratia surfactantfaciens TaxID=2741499 RepID=UPI001B3C5211
VLIKSSIPSLQLNKPKSLSEVISGASCKYYKNESENLNFRHPFEFKDNLYSFEQEYRLILDSMYMSTLTGFNPDNFGIAEIITENYESIPYHQTLPVRNASEDVQIKPGAGYVIKYPLEKIICEVRVHPLASDSYLSHVRQELINAGIDRPVNRSEITPERFSRSQRDEV